MANKIKKGDRPSTRTPRSFGWGLARWSIPDWPAAWLFPLASRISCTATAVSRIPRGLHGLQSQWRSEKKWPIRKKASNKAKSLSWNDVWVKQWQAAWAKTRIQEETGKPTLPPPTRHGERPVSTQGLVHLWHGKKPYRSTNLRRNGLVAGQILFKQTLGFFHGLRMAGLDQPIQNGLPQQGFQMTCTRKITTD